MENPFLAKNMSVSQTKDIQNRTLVIELIKNVSLAQIKVHFSKYGHIEQIQQIEGTDLYFLLYTSKESAQKATEDKSNNMIVKLDTQRVDDYVRAVTIYNLPIDVSEHVIRSAMQQFGEIAYVKTFRDVNGEPRDFAYVSFVTADGLNNALKAGSVKINEKVAQIVNFMTEQAIVKVIQEFNNPKKNKTKERMKKIRQIRRQNNCQNKDYNFKTNVSENPQVTFDNEMRIPGRVMKKQIKKLKSSKKDLAKGVKKFSEKVKKHKDLTFFQKPSEMKKRREQRRIKMQANQKQANKLFKPKKQAESIL